MKSNSFVENVIFMHVEETYSGCGWAATELASTLFQQVAISVLYVEVYLIPPGGLTGYGPPKSCCSKQRLASHSSFCKFPV